MAVVADIFILFFRLAKTIGVLMMWFGVFTGPIHLYIIDGLSLGLIIISVIWYSVIVWITREKKWGIIMETIREALDLL